MNKEEFKKKLENSLEIFNEETKREEINKYLEKIVEEEKNGLEEKEAIKKIGTIESIQKEIMILHGLDPKKVVRKNGYIYHKFEELFKVIHKVVDQMSKNSFQENAKIILDLLVLIFVICLIKIPFILVRNIGDSILIVLDIPRILDIWGLLLDVIYIIVGLMIFTNIFTKWFKNLNGKKEKNIKVKKEALESITLESKE